ncbi:MAG TPA: AAA family ATPase [Solirubrobacterales bacterium]|jgi:hypothetical protein
MRERLTASAAMPIVAWAGLLIGVPGLIALIVVSIVSSEWAALASVSFGLLIDLWVLYLLLRRHRPVEVLDTSVFRPFAPLTPEQTWPRADVTRILDRILADDDAIPFIVGASGVGKSTLLNVMVRERIEAEHRNISYIVVSSGYSDLIGQLERLIADCTEDRRKVIVLDQFEQWLALIADKRYEKRKEQQESLLEVLRKAKRQQGCKIVISLRREWYFELGFLDSLVPPPDAACDVEAPAFEQIKDPMRVGIKCSFVEILGDEDEKLAEEILKALSPSGHLSPLEAQIVGAVLERRLEAGRDIDSEYFNLQLGGVSGIVDAYFREVLDGASRPDLCMKILFALSVKTRFHNGVKLSMLVESLYENTDAVREALGYLLEKRLVVKHGPARYAITHDFLAEFFNAKSGSELNPVDRDNIQIYAAAHGEHGLAVNSRNRYEVYQRKPFGMIVVTCLLLLMIARFFYFGLNTTLVGPNIAKPLVGSMFDATYLVIFAPYAIWICYIGLFYDRLLVHLSESKLERFFSVFIVLNLIVSVLLGIFIPFAWLLGIATGGIVFGGRMLWLSRNAQIGRAAQKRLRDFALPTIGNLAFVGFIGAIGMILSFKYVKTGSEVNAWIGGSLLASAVMTYWCIALAPHHVTRSGISQLLGLIGRPGSVANAYFDD